jgi:hypothetical protein
MSHGRTREVGLAIRKATKEFRCCEAFSKTCCERPYGVGISL